MHDTHKFQPGLPGDPDALKPIKQVEAMLRSPEWRRRLMEAVEMTVPHELLETWRREALDLLGLLSL